MMRVTLWDVLANQHTRCSSIWPVPVVILPKIQEYNNKCNKLNAFFGSYPTVTVADQGEIPCKRQVLLIQNVAKPKTQTNKRKSDLLQSQKKNAANTKHPHKTPK